MYKKINYTKKKRIVVTGIGIISPVGNNISEAWRNIINGNSGIALIDRFNTNNFRTKIAGQINNFDPKKYISLKDYKKCDKFIQYGIAASVDAINDSLLEKYNHLDRKKVGVMIGSGIGGISTIEKNSLILNRYGPRRISPFFIPFSIINMLSGYLSIKYKYEGPNISIVTACSTGTHNINLAYQTIKNNDINVIIAGGAEHAITPLGISGFAATKALSSNNNNPKEASRPWDINRDGFVIGDGSGILVIEELEHAKKRNAKIYCEIIGSSMNCDAYHITKPSGYGAINSMNLALKDAEINCNEVQYINAHATSTIEGDISESNAIENIFGNKIEVSSTKSTTGHLLGASGAIESIFTIMSIKNQIIPPTINLFEKDPLCKINVISKTIEKKINIAISNSFGFGGTNGTIVFKKFN